MLLTMVTAMKFAPDRDGTDVGVAIDWSFHADKALRDLLGPLGLYNQNDILKHISTWRSPLILITPKNGDYEILRRSDGTYVYWLYGENEAESACRL